MMMVGAPLGVIFATAGTILYSKHLRLNAVWSAISSAGSDVASGKEGRRASLSLARKVAILSSHWSAAACDVSSVYAAGGEK